MSNPYPPAGGKTKVLSLDYNIAALLCYLPICCISIIVPILMLVTEPKESKFVRFHAIQSLAFAVVYAVIFGVIYVIAIATAVGTSTTGSSAAGAAGAGIGLLLLLVELALGAIGLIVVIMGMVKAYQYKIWKLPVIGDFAEKRA
jgi:uncharacterized membrane protein